MECALWWDPFPCMGKDAGLLPSLGVRGQQRPCVLANHCCLPATCSLPKCPPPGMSILHGACHAHVAGTDTGFKSSHSPLREVPLRGRARSYLIFQCQRSHANGVYAESCGVEAVTEDSSR